MNVNKIILLCWLSCVSIFANAQIVKSYAAINVVGTTGPQTVPRLAITIAYDNVCLILNGVEKYVFRSTNFDGSMLYIPAVSGNPALRTTAILVSNDHSYIRQFTQSCVMGMTLELVYDYAFIGNGHEPAYNYMGSTSGIPLINSDTRDWADCYSCGGSGMCKNCGGSGRDEYTRSGKCGVCRGSGKCPGCDGKRGYYY